MENLNVEESSKHLKVIWHDSDTFSKYTLVIFFFTWPVIFPVVFLMKGNYHHFGERWQDYYALIVSIFFLIPGILTLKFIHENDKLISLPINRSSEDIRRIVETQAKDNNFKIIRSNNKYLIAENKSKWNSGSRIVILFNQKSIYLNVQNQHGLKGYSPFSFGRNKKILTNLINEISK